jgi:AcrR family transcriptional regulator
MTKKEQVRQRIKNAATQCFLQYGLDKTTLDDIAKLVGLNKATFYYYYKNKEDIFLEVSLQEAEKFLESLQSKTLQKRTAKSRVIFYLTERVRYYRDVLSVNKVSVLTLTKILPTFFAMYNQVKEKEIQFIAQILRQGAENGEFSLPQIDKHAILFFNISDALKHKAEVDASVDQHAVPNYEQSIADISIILNQFLK